MLRDGFGFFLCNGCKRIEQHLVGHRQCVDSIFFELHPNAEQLQLARIIQRLFHVACKSGNRFCKNEVDLAQLTHADHPLKFRTVIRFHAAETLVGKNVDQLPFLLLCNVFRINMFLRCKGISLICGV